MGPHENASRARNPDVIRVAEEVASRLRARGINVLDADTPDDLERMIEAVEAFELAVEDAGGDLFVDEPPPNGSPQPDNPLFLLPQRADDDSAVSYVKRLSAATQAVRRGD